MERARFRELARANQLAAILDKMRVVRERLRDTGEHTRYLLLITATCAAPYCYLLLLSVLLLTATY